MSHGVKYGAAGPDMRGKLPNNQPQSKRSGRARGVWLRPSLQDLNYAVNSNLDVKRGGHGGGRVHSGWMASLAASMERCPALGGVRRADFQLSPREETRQIEGLWP